MKHQFFVHPDCISNGRVVIRGSDVGHIRKVLRLQSGDRIWVLDGTGNRYGVALEDVGRDQVTGSVLAVETSHTESPIRIFMGQALIKGNRFDNLLKKSVELGVNSIFPLRTERSITRFSPAEETQKLDRWSRIIEEAAKQSGRTTIPSISSSILSLEEFCREVELCDLKLTFWEREGNLHLKNVESETPVHSVAFLAGPEGGLSEEEIEVTRAHQFKTVSLGPRTLRADSASLVILTLLQYRWGDL